MMRKEITMLCLSAVCGVAHSADMRLEVDLTGRKDVVLPVEKRETVLDVAADLLDAGEDRFGAEVASSVESPFTFEVIEAEAPVVASGDEAEEPEADASEKKEPAPVVYDDAEVLRVVASNFAGRVTGTLARGATRYLQLRGGRLLKEGAVFPASVPQARDKPFNVTLVAITFGGFTLRLNEAEIEMAFQSGGGAESGAVRFSNEN